MATAADLVFVSQRVLCATLQSETSACQSYRRVDLLAGARAFFDGPNFKRDFRLDRPGEVIRWWESRRLHFNVVVGCTGIITCILMIVCAFTAENVVGEAIGMPDGPLLGVFGI